ncbi:MAG TPA: VOC family protein [Solirubrobacteraceae bacterium]
MAITYLFAGVPTADFALALSWYERFLRQSPDRYPKPGEAVWQLTDAGLLYLVADGERAGNALVTLIVDDLDRWIARLAGDGIAHGDVDVLSGGVRKTTVLDPDGNNISLGQVPAAG